MNFCQSFSLFKNFESKIELVLGVLDYSNWLVLTRSWLRPWCLRMLAYIWGELSDIFLDSVGQRSSDLFAKCGHWRRFGIGDEAKIRFARISWNGKRLCQRSRSDCRWVYGDFATDWFTRKFTRKRSNYIREYSADLWISQKVCPISACFLKFRLWLKICFKICKYALKSGRRSFWNSNCLVLIAIISSVKNLKNKG